jgi:hypothetical protein
LEEKEGKSKREDRKQKRTQTFWYIYFSGDSGRATIVNDKRTYEEKRV